MHAAQSVGKNIYTGFSNQGAVQSAQMAAHGVLAQGDALDGRAGLFAALFGGRYDPGDADGRAGRTVHRPADVLQILARDASGTCVHRGGVANPGRGVTDRGDDRVPFAPGSGFGAARFPSRWTCAGRRPVRRRR